MKFMKTNGTRFVLIVVLVQLLFLLVSFTVAAQPDYVFKNGVLVSGTDKKEGAKYRFLTQPVKFIAGEDGKLAAVECIEMKLGEPDAKGRRKPVPVENSNFRVDCDTAVLALGYWPDPIIGKTTPDLDTHDWGLITADKKTGVTSRPGIFSGGDCVTGPDLVVTAMVAGRKAAASIDEYLRNK